MNSYKRCKHPQINSKLEEYLNPDYVYIPLPDNFNIQLTDEKKVMKNDILFEKNGKSTFSPISGVIKSISNDIKINNHDVKCLVIENNFKEDIKQNKWATKYINKYSKQELLDLLKKYMPELRKFNDEKTILINGIDKEETEKNYSFIINNKSDKLLETADALSNILEIDNVIFAINNKDSNNVINLTSNIGTYPNIRLKLLPDVYPIGFKNILTKNVLSKKEIENGVIYLTVEDLINIYNVLKRRKPITEKYVTIGGNCIKESIVVNTKIGVKIADLIKSTCEIINEDYYVIVNGLISGITLESLNSIITLSTRSIFLNTLDKTSEKECINCGLCTLKCPVGLNPKYIREHKKADKSKCINCGLCSYICPSKINFKECLNNHEK
mgnify:CR=1 FL=1